MDIVAIISEYNPFHKGHKYQAEQVKRIFPDSCIVSIMSPNFVQRGFPAVFDKYIRGRCAVESGIDLAVSMPQTFALLSAEGFAESGVKIAEKIGAAYLSFGVEDNNEDLLFNIAKALVYPSFEKIIKEQLAAFPSLSYPSIRERALEKVLGKKAADFIKTPNNILAVEYVKAIIKFAPHIKILPIKRVGNSHLDQNTNGNILSASAIRKLIENKDCYIEKLPNETTDTVLSANVFNFHKYEAFLYSVVFSKSKSEILKSSGNLELADVIYKSAQIYPDYSEFRKSLSRRKHPETKIDRVLTGILLGIEFDEYIHRDPKYVTLLSANSNGKKAMAKLRSDARITLISKGSDALDESLEGVGIEITADKIYARCMTEPKYGGYFLKKKPYILN